MKDRQAIETQIAHEMLRKRKGVSTTAKETNIEARDETTQTPGAQISDPFEDPIAEKAKPLSKRRRIYFLLGGLMGAMAVWVFGSKVDANDWHRIKDSLSLSLGDFDFDFPDIFPSGMLDELLNNVTVRLKPTQELFAETDFVVGKAMANQGFEQQYPVILVPGVISSGLESWSTANCSKPYFRRRMWGTSTMVRAILLDKECWVKTLKLDPVHGLDPEGYKLRAAEGIQAADYFIAGYWIWSKIIENLAVLSYDPNSLYLASYDWRLSYYNLEVRDQYFSRLKGRIELQKKRDGKKTVLIGHSMGSQVVYYFFKWVESDGDFGGHGGSNWVEDHIESFINIAGPMLGVPKAVTAVLSGEMRDTVELNALGVYVLERFFSRRERALLFQNWGGISSMLVKGGDKIWGDLNGAPDDIEGMNGTFGSLLSFRSSMKVDDDEDAQQQRNLTVSNVLDFVFQHTPHDYHRMIDANYTLGISYTKGQIDANEKDHRAWSNPLETRLPHAPSMKIYCLYGYGKDTERAYFYASQGQVDASSKTNGTDEGDGLDRDRYRCPQCRKNATMNEEMVEREKDTQNVNFPANQVFIDADINIDNKAVPIRSGVKIGEGDGTVSLMSLGFMCSKGWKHPRYNPAGIPVYTREIRHEPTALDIRGGPKTADHIDVLGGTELNEAIIKIVSGRSDLFEEQIHSPIQQYVEKVDLDHK